jgi:hypothetical protein
MGTVDVDQQGGDGYGGENVDGLADFGIDAVGDEGAGLRRQSKRTVELIAGDGDCGYTSKSQGQADGAERGPGKVGPEGRRCRARGLGW